MKPATAFLTSALLAITLAEAKPLKVFILAANTRCYGNIGKAFADAMAEMMK